MINKVNFNIPNYNNKMAFQGEKEVKMLVEKTNKLPQNGNDVTNFGLDLKWMFEDKKISIQDILDASKQVKEEWKAKLLRRKAKALEEF